MKGIISWKQYYGEVDCVQFDTSEKSMRDTIVELLLNEWEDFGKDFGDAIVICEDEEYEDE